MQRVLTRLGETPVAVFAADWRLVWWNRSWAALLGDPSALAPEDRNLVGPGSRSPATRPAASPDWPIVSENRDGDRPRDRRRPAPRLGPLSR